MDKIIKINDYSPERGMQFNWECGHSIKSSIIDKKVVISANEAGLVSLANHLLTLAQQSIPSGYHFHLDDTNGPVENSCEIIFEKT